MPTRVPVWTCPTKSQQAIRIQWKSFHCLEQTLTVLHKRNCNNEKVGQSLTKSLEWWETFNIFKSSSALKKKLCASDAPAARSSPTSSSGTNRKGLSNIPAACPIPGNRPSEVQKQNCRVTGWHKTSCTHAAPSLHCDPVAAQTLRPTVLCTPVYLGNSLKKTIMKNNIWV